jgi:hypothetical protein
MGLFDKHKADRAADENMVKAAFDMKHQLQAQAAATQTPAIKQAMAQAKHMDMGAMQEYAQKIQRINANGADGTGMLTDVRNLGPGMNTVSARMHFQVSVTSGPGAPRSITIEQEMMGDLSGYLPGAAVSLKVNTQNPDEAMMLGPAGAAPTMPTAVPSAVPTAGPMSAAAPAGSDDTIARLEKLAQLRDSGAITPDEFAAQKARILGG